MDWFVAEFEFQYKSAIGEDLLYLDGPIVEVEITVPVDFVLFRERNQLSPLPLIAGLAIIDTGASISVVDHEVMRELGIPFVDTRPTQTVHGEQESELYNASVNFPTLGLSRLPLRRVASGLVRTRTVGGGDVIMLLGRDLLRNMNFTYDGPRSMLKIRTEASE